MLKNNYRILANLLGFYACWWLSVYGAFQGNYFLGFYVLLIYLFFHFIYVKRYKNEFYYVLFCLVFGFLIDTLLLNLKIISYNGYLPLKYSLAPLWVVCLWISFGLSIFHSFKILQKSYIISTFMGFVSGPLIFLSFNKLGLIFFSIDKHYALAVISIIWMMLIPLYVYAADKIIESNAE